MTTHIYKLFENIEELNKTVQVGGETERFSIFSNCFTVESTPSSIQEYRAQLTILQKMTFNTMQYELAKQTEFHLFALNYMLGVLYINFKLLWEPVGEFIAGFGNALSADDFWPTFYKALESSFANAKMNLKVFQFEDDIETGNDILKQLYADHNSIPERPDLHNYRNLILKIMTNCIQVCEAKNRDVVNLFLNFIEDEYKNNASVNTLRINIEAHDKTKMDVDDNEINAEDTNVEIPENDFGDSVSGKIVFKTLINVMQVLAQFKNPRALHKEPVFWELYMEFLKHKNPGLQKYALDCVLNYKNKSLLPYKTNLQNLVDEKKFKDEMTQLKITEDSQAIQPEHREDVIPIVLRILYGKMTSKLGADKKGGGQARRALVMRYISGCSENELKMFIEMAFSQLKQYMTMEPREIYSDITNKLDLKSVISPGKIQSILNLFDVVRQYFGGYMKDTLLSDFLKIFFAVSSNLSVVLQNADKVHVSYIKVMKHLRSMTISTLGKLFDQFEKYVWTKDELFVIFETLVWPLVTRLHIEGIHSPTVLLKLFNIWCQNPRYYVLLITCSEDGSLLSPLPAIFKLLLAPKTNPGVVSFILDMIEKLLTLTEDEEEKDIPSIESFSTLKVVGDDKLDMNFGSKILIPHLPSILEVMKRRIANSAKSNTVNKRDLLILSRVTEMVTTPEMCDELLNLLLPILVKKVCMNMAEENMEHAVNTIINLLGHSSNPQQYIKNIAVLFNKVGPVEVRKLLIKLLTSIAESATVDKDKLSKMAHVITEMNAFNKRWIEQPDFDRRLDAYKLIYRMLEAEEIDIDLTILIVNNCFYFIRTEKDIGLRDTAGLCLKKILPKLLSKYRSAHDGQFLVRDTVLSLISTGIRDSKNDILHSESIMLLGELVRECPDADVVLSDLVPLTNKQDREVDFFDNSCHLQLHRRVRALLKFSKVAKKMIKCPTPRTLTNFMLPLASIYICDDKYSDKNSLIDACIEVIATCCRLLPWYHYEVILKLYLNKMRHSTEHQKQLTRILIGILDAFHFDFSKVKNLELPKALTVSIKSNNIAGLTKTKKLDEKTGETNKEKDDESKIEGDDSEDEIDENVGNDKTTERLEELETDLLTGEEKDEETQVSKEVDNEPAFERITIVSPSVANRIIKSLSAGLLPQLNR